MAVFGPGQSLPNGSATGMVGCRTVLDCVRAEVTFTDSGQESEPGIRLTGWTERLLVRGKADVADRQSFGKQDPPLGKAIR